MLRKIQLMKNGSDTKEIENNYSDLLELETYVERLADLGSFYKVESRKYQWKLLNALKDTREHKERVLQLEEENRNLKNNL
jgi:hypothetical protein